MKIRTRSIVFLVAVFLLTTVVILLPRIIEARRLKAVDNATDTNKSLAALQANGSFQERKGTVIVGASVKNDTSPPLREMKQLPIGRKFEREANENPKVPTNHTDSPDPVVQGPNSLLSFAGLNIPSPHP